MITGQASTRPVPPPVPAAPRAEKSVALPLQGGGAHGAFT